MQLPMFNAIISSHKLKISHSPLQDGKKERISALVDEIPHEVLQELYDSLPGKASASTMMYICCFIAGVPSVSIAVIFGIDVSSVYRAKYRIRKMFPQDIILPL